MLRVKMDQAHLSELREDDEPLKAADASVEVPKLETLNAAETGQSSKQT